MATNGIVSIVSPIGKTLVKCVAGCDGYNATTVAKLLTEAPTLDMQSIYETCLDNGFGCSDCLVVMDANKHIFDYAEHDSAEDLSDLYRDTFTNPRFNPRWTCGIASHIELVTYDE